MSYWHFTWRDMNVVRENVQVPPLMAHWYKGVDFSYSQTGTFIITNHMTSDHFRVMMVCLCALQSSLHVVHLYLSGPSPSQGTSLLPSFTTLLCLLYSSPDLWHQDCLCWVFMFVKVLTDWCDLRIYLLIHLMKYCTGFNSCLFWMIQLDIQVW